MNDEMSLEAPRHVGLPPATVRAMWELMALYLPDKDIADRLGVKIDSVRWYRMSGNRAAAAAAAARAARAARAVAEMVAEGYTGGEE